MHRIDIHIILFGEPPWKIDRCLDSLKDEPVNLHFVEGVKEMPPYKGRATGFAMGDAPYCGYVDPDDEVVPGCFQILLAAIESGDYDAAYGWEFAGWGPRFTSTENIPEINQGVIRPNPHHAFLLKRGLDIDYSQEYLAVHALPKDRVYCVPQVLYHWRRD